MILEGRERASHSSVSITEETIEEILLRLAVKSVVRFRCVSKSWKSLFHNSSFIFKHTTIAINRSRKNHTLLTTNGKHRSDIEYRKYSEKDDSFVCQEIFSTPPIIKWDGNDQQQCCGGLIYLSFPRGDCVLWNPVLRKQFRVPDPVPYVSSRRTVGLWYDENKNDYKMIYLDHEAKTTKVYELSKNEWRGIATTPPGNIFSARPVFVHGSLHWIGVKRLTYYWFVVVFDTSSEVFKEMELPFSCVLIGKTFPLIMLAQLGDSLSFIYGTANPAVWDIWRMREYGVSASWIKHFTINMGYRVLSPSRSGIALTLRKVNEIIAVVGKEVLVFNVHNETPVSCHSFDSPLNSVDYRFDFAETLALLDYPLVNIDESTDESSA
ncbi:hypothetical protein K2173_002336 [Erythroxylum novogranatense]|uniref:F-box domain-containing protein n=1 Tax=Erythroxylum novogranatense TaxID=1862640 RepID=A0AAV8T9U5_9ROSI|nr:hypothetical protein K2173_002336 [Erythroxylum novogranatense]